MSTFKGKIKGQAFCSLSHKASLKSKQSSPIYLVSFSSAKLPFNFQTPLTKFKSRLFPSGPRPAASAGLFSESCAQRSSPGAGNVEVPFCVLLSSHETGAGLRCFFFLNVFSSSGLILCGSFCFVWNGTRIA